MIHKTEYRGKFTRVKTAKRKKPSSTKWLQRQLNDPFVLKSKLDGYKSRAAYKLIEIHNKFNLLKHNDNVVDLGAAPGGWSQVAANLTNADNKDTNNKIIAIDLLPIDKIPGTITLQKDFFDDDTKELIINNLDGEFVDTVLSDMAANTIGHAQTDHFRILDLCENALIFALKILKPGGNFVAKIFQGGTENDLLSMVKQNFHKIKHFKPKSSRKESNEFYLVALDRK